MDIKVEIQKNRRQTNEIVETIRANPSLSAQGRREALEQVYSKALERHQRLKEQYDAQLEERREQLRGQLFRPAFTIGQPDYIREDLKRTYRLNLQEADALVVPSGHGETEYRTKNLLRYLEASELSDDELAARAAFTIASNKGVREVIDRYLETRPEAAERYQEHQRLEQETREPSAIQRFAQAFELAPPQRPEEIQNDAGNRSALAGLFGGE